jgi:eukaryotic-like serine/threonine-protein kinase
LSDGFDAGQMVNDRYRVLGKLGGGGMADVYLAEDTTLGRRVALKVLLQRFVEDETFVERFRREAKAAAGLNHPNVVSIYDWGQIDHVYYIVMEYVEGETLKERIRRVGRLPAGEAVAIVVELLSAVQFAHANNVVHRDIKSQNILIDRHGKVKVTDFGIARAGDSSMTEAGSILGTAQYLAPEQAKGERVDERSDLYSVGVVLYEMLTGSVPFKGDSAVTVAMKHVNELPVEPAELVPGLPYALNQIVLKALAKSPERRYASAAEFAQDLRSAMAGGPLVAATFDFAAERTQVMRPLAIPGEAGTQVMPARSPATTSESRRPKRRRRWAWLLALLLLLVVAGAAYAVYHALSGTATSVPSVVGLTEAAATKSLQDAGFKVGVHDDYSDQFAEGFVTRQQPAAGTKLISGGKVDIWVSRGAKTVALSDFRGWAAAEVAKWLKDNGLVGVEKKGHSPTVPAGTVFKQSPAAFQTVMRGETVTYWVSSGVAQVAVPDLSGGSQADAKAALEAVGLKLGLVSTQPSDTVLTGDVISQDPPAGNKVDTDTSVAIVVSSGSPTPSPTPTSTTSPVNVPNVYGMDVGMATSTLSAAGFLVSVKEKSSAQPAGTVIKMVPEADTMAPAGSTVLIVVAK